ncbi:MAG: acyl-CoA dehydrogenase family protein, partial [Burkholderiaceae bacterium]|nr:acyl-CoA dehydrogenase family protein [Burkholderiaceae bacterium]
MNPADLPPELAAQPADLIDAVRAIAQGPLASQAYAIDRGAYPVDVMKQLAAAGAMSAHLTRADGTPGDYGPAIAAMAEAAKVCGATGFMMWCQCVAGLYMQASGNPALTGERLARHVRGDSLGGTGLSNPMKSFAQIEALLLK